jgi:hypothetical protein
VFNLALGCEECAGSQPKGASGAASWFIWYHGCSPCFSWLSMGPFKRVGVCDSYFDTSEESI